MSGDETLTRLRNTHAFTCYVGGSLLFPEINTTNQCISTELGALVFIQRPTYQNNTENPALMLPKTASMES